MSDAEFAPRAHEARSAGRVLVAEATRLVDRVLADRQTRQLAARRRAETRASSAALRRRRAARPAARLHAAASLSRAVRAEAAALRAHARFQIRHAAELARRAARLTSREEEVLALVAHGYTNAAIARRLDIAESSVASYRRRGMEKIGAERVSELVSWASEAGLFPNPEA